MPKPKLMKAGSPDEFQTDPSALDCLEPYLQKDWTIWEPAAGHGKLAVKLASRGRLVRTSDIQNYGGTHWVTRDFLKEDCPDYYDAIVTNPPFSLKEEFMGRCYMLDKPFALLMPITTFDSEQRRKLMAAKGIEVILPSRRIHFETPNFEKNKKSGKKEGGAWFYSAWFTWGLKIGRQLVFTDPQSLGI